MEQSLMDKLTILADSAKIRRRLHVQRRVPCSEGRYSRQLLRAGLLPRIHRRRPLRQPAEGPDEQLLCF